MTTPEPAPAPEPPLADDPIQALRAEIDQVDDELLALAARRMQFAPKLAAVKGSAVGVAAMRPAREVQIMRRLIAQAPAQINPELIMDLWRALMSASLRAQTEIEVVMAGSTDMVRLNDVVRRYFGFTVKLSQVNDARAALSRAADSDRVVAAVPWPGNNGPGMWWPCLTENRYHGLSVAAALPLRGEPEAALLGRGVRFEAGGGDDTIAIAFDPHHKLTRALNLAGLSGRELGRAQEKLLFLIDGYVPPDDPRLVSAVRAGLDNLRVIGCFSRV